MDPAARQMNNHPAGQGGAGVGGNGGGVNPCADTSIPKNASADELEVLIRARYPIIYVLSWEEERVEKQIARIAATRNKKFYVWTCTEGIVRYGSEASRGKAGNTTDPLTAIDAVVQAGGIVEFAAVLVDREQGGRQNIEAKGYKAVTAFSRTELLPNLPLL